MAANRAACGILTAKHGFITISARIAESDRQRGSAIKEYPGRAMRGIGGGRQSSTGASATSVVVVGGGLAGSEAAWQVARRGLRVRLYEMRPARMTPAHRSGFFAELVCSNSLGSNLPDRALGLLKNELRRLGSLIMACADANAVPAGDALAVDREAFSRAVHWLWTERLSAGRSEALRSHPNIEIVTQELTAIPQDAPVILATGPLTSPPLAEAIREMAGQDHLFFFDAMAPIVVADSIDMQVAFRGSRRRTRTGPDHGAEGGPAADYINCPLSREQYYAFVDALIAAEKAALHDFEQDGGAAPYFEACLPIEVLAARDRDALAFGPMRPIGLRDPHTGRRPFAVVQLRQDNVAGTLYNLVGFQTNIRWRDQERILRMIPGLERAEFVRFGQMHRNMYINSPLLLRPTLQWRTRDDLFLAGQITGTEGYVGSTTSGLIAGLNAARWVQGRQPVVLPRTTMAGALLHYISHADPRSFQPMKANFGLLPELDVYVADRQKRHAAYADRALAELDRVLARGQIL